MTDVEDRDPVSRAMLWIASLARAAMMLVVVADVVLRFAFDTPVRGAYDVVSIGLLVMVFFGIAPVIVRRGEILIDLIDPLLPRPALRLLGIVATAGTLAVFLFLGWSMIGPAMDAHRYGDRSLELGLPVWWLWAVAFVGLAGILWAAVLLLRRELRGTPPARPSEEGGL
jgi:TRAP-type C4-dicarboxylate transport system permease small subunit